MNNEEYNLAIDECAYKQMGEMTAEEIVLCRQESIYTEQVFLRFLRWVKIVEAPIPGQTGGGVIPFGMFGHIKELIKALMTHSLISVLKSRQVYVSTTMAAYHLWLTLGTVGANLLLFSKGQPEAKELLGKSHRMLDLLPPFMRAKLDPDSTEEMGFPIMKSAIKAFPSTQSAGISYTSSLVTCDEHAEHPYADENYISSKPTRDRGGQFVSVFTANPFTNDNLATAIFTDALSGKCHDCGIEYGWEEYRKHEGHKVEKKNDFVPLFFPYDVVPGRDWDWYESTKKNIPERELAKLSPDLYMSKNYPRSIEEALGLAETVAVFDKQVINRMMDDVRGKMNENYDGINNEFVNIYKNYHIGNIYIAFSDVSLGVGRDFNVTCIMDCKTGDIVADIMSQYLGPDEFTLNSTQLLNLYGNPTWWIEENMWGRTVIKKAIELGYRNLGYRDEKRTKVGFVTDDKSRTDLFGALIPAINNHQITIYNRDGLKQFYNIVRNMSRKGKVEAISGQHDDYVIAVGGCWLKRQTELNRMGLGMMKPINTLTFNRNVGVLR